jgi:AcrR family transcriptional regulator
MPARRATPVVGDEPAAAVRRAPFARSPHLGPRGQRTRQKIVDASLRVFAEQGYHQCSIDRITGLAGCSRVSFYQYFSGKEDLFRHLAGQVARQLGASTEALTLLTPDAEGWTALRAWVARYTDIYSRYSAVFHAFPAAAESDELVAGGSVRVGRQHVEQFRSSLATTDLPPRRLDPVINLLMESLPLTHDAAEVLHSVAPDAFPTGRIADALTDVAHRTLFGRHDDVNVQSRTTSRPPVLAFGPVMRDAIEQLEAPPALTEARRRTRDALIHAGRDVFVKRGYHGTRVDDIAEAAGLSHGTFYRYFGSTDQLAHVLAAHAMQRVSGAFAEVPDLPTVGSSNSKGSDASTNGAGAIRQWLRRYNAAHTTEAALIRVWVDAALQDPALRDDSAAAVDRGRRQMARFLEPRRFGDVDIEAVVLVALIGAFGATPRTPPSIDAAAYIIERGLLGR